VYYALFELLGIFLSKSLSSRDDVVKAAFHDTDINTDTDTDTDILVRILASKSVSVSWNVAFSKQHTLIPDHGGNDGLWLGR